MKINTGNAESLASSVSSGVSREFHSFLADIEDLVKDTTSLTGEDLAKAKAKLSARVAAARESVEDMSDAVVSRARKTAKATDQYVHEQPWKVIGASAAIAFLVGFALARRE
jgi:ElaB/YqjD/DUF883 family membrane-anchored ribosome-binding protein